jgi:hypothetical protein
MITVTKVKTRSGLEFYVKEDDFYILTKSSEDLFIYLTVLIYASIDFEVIQSQSSEFFHRDEIIWFKTRHIK